MTRIGILGDTHGDVGWLKYAINKFKREGLTEVYQLGDLGVYPTISNGWNKVNGWLKQAGITIKAVPGNHEDYDHIAKLPVAPDGFQHFRSNVLLATRGQRWEIDGRSVVALGGAPSVDRTGRLRWKGKHWWAEEAITEEDAQRTIRGGHADIMIAHDAPFTPGIDRRISGNPMNWDEVDLHYAREGRKVMDKVVQAVAPEVFLHGHYHFFNDEVIKVGPAFALADQLKETRVVSFSKNNANYSLGVLDTETLDVTVWDIAEDYKTYLQGDYHDRSKA